MNEPMRPVIDDDLVDWLMAQVDAEGLELLTPDGDLAELTSQILSRGLEVEMADHLGYERATRLGGGRETTATIPMTKRSTPTLASFLLRCPGTAMQRLNRY